MGSEEYEKRKAGDISDLYTSVPKKAGKFRPEYANKLNFYLSAVDSQLRHSTDNASIGIILCRMEDKIEVEYSLRDMNKPMIIEIKYIQ